MAKKIIGLDFETEIDDNNNSRLLLCCLNGNDYEKTFDLTVRKDYEEFYFTLILSGHKYVVFNASFDIEIIITILLKNNFTFLSNNEDPDHKTMKLIMGQKIYCLTTYYKYEGKLVESQFVDLANLIVGASLEEVAEKFTPYKKGNFEVSKLDWQQFKEYCMLDAKITRVAYENITKTLGMETLTIGAAAFNIMLDMNFVGNNKKSKMKQFKRIFGDNTLEDDEYLRKWYAGGLGWASTDDRTETRIHSYDLKSAYPAVSIDDLPTTKDLLTYEGYMEPTQERPFAFIHMKITGQVKVNHVPILPSRNIYGDSNIYIYDDKDVYIIQEFGKKSEYEYFMENIEIDNIEYVSTMLMKRASSNPLRKYMLKYYDLKQTSEGIERELYKRLLNALTGKLGTNPMKENIKFELDAFERLVKSDTEEVEIDTYATQVVAVITSRVRCECYEADTIIRDKVPFRMYATDSVKHTANGIYMKSSKELGGWALEKEDISFIFLGLKAYIFDALNEKGERQVMCAGISRKYKNLITNEQFFATTKVKSLISVRSGNGRILYEGYKKIVQPISKPRRRQYGRNRSS